MPNRTSTGSRIRKESPGRRSTRSEAFPFTGRKQSAVGKRARAVFQRRKPAPARSAAAENSMSRAARAAREPSAREARSAFAGEADKGYRRAMTLTRRLVGEGLGTAFLLVAVVGSGIMAERLAGGNAAIALLANSLATGGALVALIVTFAPVSGAHFNPAVTVALAARGELKWADALPYVVVQFAAAILDVAAAHAMFGLPLLEWSQKARPGLGQMWAE